ncbi:hypothetical protein D3C83_25030 [compost metagenome]
MTTVFATRRASCAVRSPAVGSYRQVPRNSLNSCGRIDILATRRGPEDRPEGCDTAIANGVLLEPC